MARLRLIRSALVLPAAVVVACGGTLMAAGVRAAERGGGRHLHPGEQVMRQLYGRHFIRGRVSPLNWISRPRGRRPKGYVLLIHGGGWILTGFTDTADPAWLNANGWATYSVDYRPGWPSLGDTVAAYDHLRRVVGKRTAVCALGQSAGGTLAMLLAAIRPGLDCAISEAGIADIRSMTHQCAYQHRCGGVAPAARMTFEPYGHDPRALWRFSPVRLARLITQPLLMAGSSHDACIDEPDQLREMRAARPQTHTLLLPGSDRQPANFTHASVTPRALVRYRAADLRLLDRAALRHSPRPQRRRR